MGVGDTRLEVAYILLEAIRLVVACIHLEVELTLREDIHLAVGFILLGFIRQGVVYSLLDPGLFRALVDLLRGQECPSTHLVVDPPEGLLGQARSTLPVRVFSLLEVALRGPALLSTLRGLVLQALMDRALTDQGQTAQVQMDQARMGQARMEELQLGLVQTDQVQLVQAQVDQVLMAQARTDLVPMGLVPMVQVPMVQVPMVQGQMARVRMAQARTDPVQMGLVRMAQAQTDQVQIVQAQTDLGVEATAKSPRSSPPRNTSAQLRLHLHHAPLHLKPSWQNVLQQTLSLEDRIAHFALLALFALSPTRALCKYQTLIVFVENKLANISFPVAQAPQQSRSPSPQPQAPFIIATARQL